MLSFSYIYDQKEIYGIHCNYLKLFQTSTFLDPKKWHFMLLTWSPKDGILIFVDGPLFAKSELKINITEIDSFNSRVILGRRNTAPTENTYAAFGIEMVTIFYEFVPDGKVFMSYSFSREFLSLMYTSYPNLVQS